MGQFTIAMLVYQRVAGFPIEMAIFLRFHMATFQSACFPSGRVATAESTTRAEKPLWAWPDALYLSRLVTLW